MLLAKIEPHLARNKIFIPISGQFDRTTATETVDAGSISGQVKSKTIEIGNHNTTA